MNTRPLPAHREYYRPTRARNLRRQAAPLRGCVELIDRTAENAFVILFHGVWAPIFVLVGAAKYGDAVVLVILRLILAIGGIALGTALLAAAARPLLAWRVKRLEQEAARLEGEHVSRYEVRIIEDGWVK